MGDRGFMDFVRVEHPYGTGQSLYIERDRIVAVAEDLVRGGAFIWADLHPGIFVGMPAADVAKALAEGATELPPKPKKRRRDEDD